MISTKNLLSFVAPAALVFAVQVCPFHSAMAMDQQANGEQDAPKTPVKKPLTDAERMAILLASPAPQPSPSPQQQQKKDGDELKENSQLAILKEAEARRQEAALQHQLKLASQKLELEQAERAQAEEERDSAQNKLKGVMQVTVELGERLDKTARKALQYKTEKEQAAQVLAQTQKEKEDKERALAQEKERAEKAEQEKKAMLAMLEKDKLKKSEEAKKKAEEDARKRKDQEEKANAAKEEVLRRARLQEEQDKKAREEQDRAAQEEASARQEALDARRRQNPKKDEEINKTLQLLTSFLAAQINFSPVKPSAPSNEKDK
jgi:hypothetical protein